MDLIKKSLNVGLLSFFLLSFSTMLVVTENAYSGVNQTKSLPAVSLLLLSENQKYLDIDGWGKPGEVDEPTTDTEAYEQILRLNQIGVSFESALEQVKNEYEPFQKAINMLKNNPDIKAIEVIENTIYIYDKYGGRFNIPLIGRIPKDASLNDSKLHSEMQSALQKLNNNKITYPFRKKALIFSGYQDVFNENALCVIYDSLKTAGFYVDFIVNTAMCGLPANPFDSSTLVYLDNIYDYGLVYINSHGGPDEIYTGIPVELNNQISLKFAQKKGVETGKTKDDEVDSFTLKSDYFKNNGSFYNTIFHVDGCQVGLHKDHFSDKILAKGASLFISYDDYILYNEQAREFSQLFYRRLSTAGTTINNAIDSHPKLPTSWPSFAFAGVSFWGISITLTSEPSITFGYSGTNGNNLVLLPDSQNYNGIVSGTVLFYDDNNQQISIPSDAWIRITPSVYHTKWDGTLRCFIDSNGKFGTEQCYADIDEEELRSAFNNSNETFQVVVYKEHIHENEDEHYWNCGEDVYKFVGENISNESWENITVLPNDYEDRSGENCSD